MKNSKWIKTLLSTVVCASMATAVVTSSACKETTKKPGGDGSTHTHNYTWVADEDGKNCHQECNADGECDAKVKPSQAHVDLKNNATQADGADGKCDNCGATVQQGDEYDIITTSVDFKAAANELAGAETTANQTVGSGGYTYGGKFYFSEGGRFEPGKSCINTQKRDIRITLGGIENSIKIVGQGASGTAGDVVLKDANDKEWGKATSTGNGTPISIAVENLPAGVYTLVSGTSVRISELSISEKLEKSEAAGISVTASKVDFLKGEDFSAAGLTVILNYENGRKDTLSASDYTVTQSVDKNTAGKYTVTVKYKANENFTDTYDVYVYTIDSIEMHTIGYLNKKQVTLQQATVTGTAVTADYLTVKGKGTVEGRSCTFNLPASALEVTFPDVSSEGEKTVNYSVKTDYTTDGKTLNGSYKVAVKSKKTVADNKVEVTVGETGDFKTLTQAVQYLKACNYESKVNKVIKLQAGTYTEKVWLDIDNVTLVGGGENIDDTILTYSLVEGDADALSGSLWGLDCATLHVTGTNFKAYNLAIRNDFDYINNANKYSGNQAAQGLALTLDTDGAVLFKCHLYGNQDTLYMKSGRSYYYQSQIDGNVDFIFGGETSLAYFDECKVVAINRTAVADGEKGKEQNGYVTAAKHVDASKPDYGYVFNNCEFTDDGKVKDGAMSLGRPWGAKATVAYIGCSFSAAYSTLASDAEGKDHRWSEMSGVSPTNADFCEYGSTGAGAITTAVTGGKVLDAAQAANYTKTNVFGTANGKQSYTTVFDCDTALSTLRILAGLDEGEIPEDPTVTVSLKDETLPNGDCLAAINEKHAETLSWEGTAVFETAKPENGVKVGLDTVITVNVVGEVSLIAGYQLPVSDYVITYSAGKATIRFTSITGTYGDYIGSIVIDTSKTPEDTQTVDITVDYNDGATPNATLTAVVGSPLAKPADPVRDGYKFVGWKVNGADYDFTQNVTEAFTLVAEWEVAGDIDLSAGGTVNLYEFTTGTVQGNTATYRGIIVDATESGAKFAPRPDRKDVQVNAGVKLKFKVNAGTTKEQVGISFTANGGSNYLPTFTIEMETIGADTYAVVTLTCNSYPSTMTVIINA